MLLYGASECGPNSLSVDVYVAVTAMVKKVRTAVLRYKHSHTSVGSDVK